jgi:hypothetical protein
VNALYRGIATEDGRLLSSDPIFTYKGKPIAELYAAKVELDVLSGCDPGDEDPDETEEDDFQEAAE